MGARVKAMAKFRRKNYSDLSFTYKSIELPSINNSKSSYANSESQGDKKNRRSISQEFLEFADN